MVKTENDVVNELQANRVAHNNVNITTKINFALSK